MSFRTWMLAASLGAATMFSAGSAMASPVQISGCTINAGTTTQTCNFYETDANGSPSEISSPVSNLFPGTFWHAGYSAIDDPDSTLSDVIVWNAVVQTGTLYSCDDGGLATCAAAIVGLTNLGTGTEDANGDLLGATKSRFSSITGGDQVGPDILNVYSPPERVPEPITLSMFGAGLVGAVAMRRRKAKRA